MTKKELEEKNVILAEQKREFAEQDEKIREEISRALGKYIYENEFGYTHQKRKLDVLSWSQIFTELGKLLERQKRLNYVEDVERLHREIDELKKEDNSDTTGLHPIN